MSLLKANSVQIGQSATATNNFTLSVPSSPDGTIKLARGNSGATTADVLSVNASGAITGATISGATISGATINSSTINGGSITLGTAQNSTSGTAIDFTGIPSWAKKITVMLNGVSTSGSSNLLVQIGAGSVTTSGYQSAAWTCNTLNSTSTNGYLITAYNSAGAISYGNIFVCAFGSNTWIESHAIGAQISNNSVGGGSITLSGTLDRVRITTANGTDTFDAGSINIMYEG